MYTGMTNNIKWKHIKTPDNGYINLTDKILPYEFAVCYAVTYIFSSTNKTVHLFIGSDDGAKVFLNNKQLYRYLGIRIAEPDQAEIALNLKTGWNKLLIKIENNLGGYAFYARISGRDSTLIINADQKKPEVLKKKNRRKK
jgi:outer membrane protein assembly factor BamB